MRAVASMAFALIVLTTLVSCPVEPNGNKNGISDKGRVYVVDVSEETDWDYFVVAQDRSSAFYTVDKTSGLPTELFFKPDKDSDDGISIFFKENGLPDKAVGNGHILYFGNFRGYRYDMAIIKPNNTIEYKYDIETDVNWGALSARALNARTASGQERAAIDVINTGLEWAGRGIGIASCAGIFVTAGVSVVPCATFLASEAGGYLIDKLEEAGAIDSATAGMAKVIIDTLNCGGGLDLVDCFSAVGGVCKMLFGDDLYLVQQKETQLQLAIYMIDGDGDGDGDGGGEWTALPTNIFGSSDISSIAYGNDRFVAGSYSGGIAYYDDAEGWVKVSTTALPGTEYIAFGNGRFVAGAGGGIAYSANGTGWTRVEYNKLPGYPREELRINKIAYGNGKFVVVGNGGGMAYSQDGENWTELAYSTIWDVTSGNITLTEDKITAIAYGGPYGNGRFVAGGLSGIIAFSDDGINWNRAASTFAEASSLSGWLHIMDIAYGGTRWVAVGGNGRIAYSDDHGVHWTAVADSTFGLTQSDHINAIVYGNNGFSDEEGVFFAGGRGGKMAYSIDGINWTRVSNSTFGTSAITAIAYGPLFNGGGRFVAVGANGKMAYCDWSGGGDPGNVVKPTAPVLSAGSVNRTSDAHATISFTASGAGSAYYTVLSSGAPAPANTAVRNVAYLGTVTAGANSGKPVALTAGAKDIYVVVQNAAGDISAPLKIAAAAYSGGGNQGSGSLNGTWVDGGEKWVLNNGGFTISQGNTEMIKGTYSTSGNNITMAFTQLKGAMFGENASGLGLLASQWYTQQQLRTTVVNHFVGMGLSRPDAEELYGDEMGYVSELFEPDTAAYTLSGNTLTIGTIVLTRQQ